MPAQTPAIKYRYLDLFGEQGFTFNVVSPERCTSQRPVQVWGPSYSIRFYHPVAPGFKYKAQFILASSVCIVKIGTIKSMLKC